MKKLITYLTLGATLFSQPGLTANATKHSHRHVRQGNARSAATTRSNQNRQATNNNQNRQATNNNTNLSDQDMQQLYHFIIPFLENFSQTHPSNYDQFMVAINFMVSPIRFMNAVRSQNQNTINNISRFASVGSLDALQIIQGSFFAAHFMAMAGLTIPEPFDSLLSSNQQRALRLMWISQNTDLSGLTSSEIMRQALNNDGVFSIEMDQIRQVINQNDDVDADIIPAYERAFNFFDEVCHVNIPAEVLSRIHIVSIGDDNNAESHPEQVLSTIVSSSQSIEDTLHNSDNHDNSDEHDYATQCSVIEQYIFDGLDQRTVNIMTGGDIDVNFLRSEQFAIENRAAMIKFFAILNRFEPIRINSPANILFFTKMLLNSENEIRFCKVIHDQDKNLETAQIFKYNDNTNNPVELEDINISLAGSVI